MNIKYYLIHGLDRRRKIFMEAQFRHHGIKKEDVTWVLRPNKDDLLPDGICKNPNLTLGQIAVTYKHYLILQDIVNTNTELAVVMEDNIEFLSNAPLMIERYLRELPEDWGCLFDGDIFNWRFIESPVSPQKVVYKKSNEVTSQCDGASKGANFILLNQKSAKLLKENFLPFSYASDHVYNELIRKLNLNVYWAEPPNVHKIERKSTWR